MEEQLVQKLSIIQSKECEHLLEQIEREIKRWFPEWKEN